MMKFISKFLLIFLLLTNFSIKSYSQISSGTLAIQEMRSLINLQTAGTLNRGNLGIELDFLPRGQVISSLGLGITDFFSLGLSYSFENLVGSGDLKFKQPLGYNVKFRLYRESRVIPSISIGLNTKGKGQFLDSLNRYQIKSKGFYLSMTKNYKFLGYFSLHAQLNYSLENLDNDKDLNVEVGIEKTIGPSISLIADYDFAFNDNYGKSKNEGYLNIGLRWSTNDELVLGFNISNLFSIGYNDQNYANERSFYIEYIPNIY